MKTKFIEGTNKQYSIREDGVFTRYYTINYNINTKNFDKTIFKEEILKDKKGTVYIGNHKRISTNKLLRQYFKQVYCIKCKVKVEDLTVGKRTKSICINCKTIPSKRIYIRKPVKPLLTDEQKKINLQKSRKNWEKNNIEKIKKNIDRNNKRKFNELPKYEIASRLGINVKDLTDDLYNHHKINIKIKRLLSEKTGLHTSNFK